MPFPADKYPTPGVDGRLREPPRSTPPILTDPREFSLNHRYHAPLQRFPRCLAPGEPTMLGAPEACACPLWSQWRGPKVPCPSSAGVPNRPKLGQPKFFFLKTHSSPPVPSTYEKALPFFSYLSTTTRPHSFLFNNSCNIDSIQSSRTTFTFEILYSHFYWTPSLLDTLPTSSASSNHMQ